MEKGNSQTANTSNAELTASLRLDLAELQGKGDKVVLGQLSGVLGFAEALAREQAIIQYTGTLDLTVSLVDEVEPCGEILEEILPEASVSFNVDESDCFTRVVLYRVGGAEVEEMIELALEAVQSRLEDVR